MSVNLSHLNGAYQALTAKMLPAGRYPAVILTAVVDVSGRGNVQIEYTLEVESPATAYRSVVKKFTQLSEEKLYWAIAELNLLEVPLGRDIDSLPEALKTLSGARVEVDVGYVDNYNYPVPRFIELISKPAVKADMDPCSPEF